jgi:hypothetical protein
VRWVQEREMEGLGVGFKGKKKSKKEMVRDSA